MLGEEFSKANPVKIKDTDVSLHGTSSKKYLAIKSTGFLKRKAPATNPAKKMAILPLLEDLIRTQKKIK